MLNINGEDWEILLVSPNHPMLMKSNGEYTIGACDDNKKTIYINNQLNDFYTKKVLGHELTHAAMFSYNINLTYWQEELLADLVATYGQEIVHMTNAIFKRIQEIGEAI
jgi:hypothetical protein